MKRNKGKIISIFLIVLSVVFMGVSTYAHSGRTDANGGHRDNQNKSGLGSYHYHCGGHEAHLHPNGVCPYSSSSSSSSRKSSTSSSSSSSSSKSSTSSSSSSTSNSEPSTVEVTEIEIDEEVESIEEGKIRFLTATITPDNASDKNVTWKSSDESIATISSGGMINAIKPGKVTITATSSNGKTNSIEIEVKEKQNTENNTMNVVKVSDNTNSNAANTEESSNLLGGIVVLGLLGGGSYLGYKKYKEYNKS